MSDDGRARGSRRGISPDEEHAFIAALESLPARQGRLERWLGRLIRAGFRFAAWRLESDLDRLPRHGAAGAGCVIVPAPHRAWVEPFLLLAAWPSDGTRLVWLADGDTVTRSWWRRRLLPRLGVLPIAGRPGSMARTASVARELLDRGFALVVFPEVGPPSPADGTRRISPGFAYLALAAGATVVPVVVAGTHHLVRGSSFVVASLAPIGPDGPPAELRAPGTRRGAHAIAGRYRAMLDAALVERNAETDARRPARDRWPWLARLFG